MPWRWRGGCRGAARGPRGGTVRRRGRDLAGWCRTGGDLGGVAADEGGAGLEATPATMASGNRSVGTSHVMGPGGMTSVA